MTHTETLKPCPFCASENVEEQCSWFCDELQSISTHCKECDACMNSHDWNNRPIEDTLTKRVAVLEEASKKLIDNMFLLRGGVKRLSYRYDGSVKNSAPFPSAIVVFKGETK